MEDVPRLGLPLNETLNSHEPFFHRPAFPRGVGTRRGIGGVGPCEIRSRDEKMERARFLENRLRKQGHFTGMKEESPGKGGEARL